MPSKNKKGSKSASKLSNSSDQSSSVTSPWNPNSAPPQQRSEIDVHSILEEASRKFPSLISKNALVAQITDDADTESIRGTCKLWLSESSMLTYSLSPGSTVSVSLASSTKLVSTPVRSLADVCEKQFGCSEHQMVSEVGNYFVLAAVFPSRKILKNGVRLSRSLSRTMGSPPFDSILFVHPVCLQPTVRFANGNGKLQTTSHLSISTCKELYLELVSSDSESAFNFNKLQNDAFSSETTIVQAENGKVSSPKTPFSQSKFSSPSISRVSTPRGDESVSSNSNNYRTTVPTFEIQEILENESAKNLLQTCATSWLSSRSLLCGNIVVIPILSKLCLFQVMGANRLCTNHHILNAINDSHCDIDLDLMDHVDDAFLVDHNTKVYLFPPLGSIVDSAENGGLLRQDLDYKEVRSHANAEMPKLGGISKQYAQLKDIIISSSLSSRFSSLGLRPIKGVLLHGPPGTGKTSLAKLCIHDTGVNLFHVKGPEIVSQYYGESEQALHEVFDSASRAAPAVVFIDELDAIAPARKDGSEELSQRMVATLLNLMDGIISVEGLLVIAATNRPDSIEPALRRPGRFDIEIDMGVPSPDQRYSILLALLKENEHSLSDTEVQYLAKATHGFVGADLAVLCNEAKFICLRRYTDMQVSYDESHCNISPLLSLDVVEGFDRPDDISDLTSPDHLDYTCSSTLESSVKLENLDDEILNLDGTCAVKKDTTLRVSFDDFERARKKIGPSAMREVILEIPNVSWEDVGGQQEVKMQLKEAVEWPQKYQDSFKSLGILPPKGVLMFGPPGCSKTLLARAVASEAGLNFLAVKGPELFSMWVGESEKAVRSLFAKATANAPSIIFFDEIDSLASIRGKESDGVSVGDRVISQLLVEMDGLQKRVDVTVIAATNRPDNIDPALLRPGRFDRLLYVGPPNVADREDIFKVHLCKMPCSTDVCPKELALCTEGCSGADIFQICREAALAALEETFDASCITMKHLKHAISQAQPSLVQFDQNLLTKFQRMVHSTATEDELGCQSSSSTTHTFSFWTPIKSIMEWLLQFPSTLLRAKSSSP